MDRAAGPCPPPPEIVAAQQIELRVRGDFVSWLESARGSLAVTTYNSGKLALFSVENGELASSYWKLPRPMGVAFNNGRLAVATQRHLWLLAIEGDRSGQLAVDRVYFSGRLDAHDVAFDRRGLLFANTRFNCIARPSERRHFVRTWRPPFMSGDERKDCCHLNGLGVRNGRLAMATAFCEQSAIAAWRGANRFECGVLIDVRAGAVVTRGLCMPHSPRWHAGRWWLCDSGRGFLATFDENRGECDAVAALPGFTRGLSFAHGRAIVGLSRVRKKHILDAPPVREGWKRLRSGLALIDVERGVETGSLEFLRGGREVYDVAFLPASCATANDCT
jgi:uncharacterized protein (TIGR03032 family)